MKSRIFFGRSSFGRKAFAKFCFSGLILAGAMSAAVQAQGMKASAQLSGVSLGRAGYAYTLTLENTPASTSDIQMFWFAWEAGQADFLESSPTSVQAPAGWNFVVEGGGPDDGYSIQFVTFTTPLTPGSSLTFTFDSPDSPKIMAGPAAFYPEYPTMSSQVYSGHAASGVQELFLVQVLPEAPTLTNNLPATNHISLAIAPAGRTINFAGAPGANYVVQSSVSPNGPWTDLSSSIKAMTNGLVQYTDTTTPLPPVRYYRTRSAP